MKGWAHGVYKGHSHRMLSGMSLIEIAITVTILGIFAAIFLSRLVLITEDARTASISTVRGAFVGGINGAHNQWLAESQPQKIKIEGIELAINNTGWPESVSETANGHVTPEKCLEVWNAIMRNPPIAGVTCVGNCLYTVTAVKNTSGRMECLYTNKKSAGGETIFYDMATGFIR
jgi:prepilin-type N-terminal cleavage/methylation domain-containing protein